MGEAGDAAEQGFGMGDLTEVGEVVNYVFTLLMSVFFLPFLAIKATQGQSCRGCLSTEPKTEESSDPVAE